MLLDMPYSRDSAPPMEQKLCVRVRVDGLRICILEDIARGRGYLMTWPDSSQYVPVAYPAFQSEVVGVVIVILRLVVVLATWR